MRGRNSRLDGIQAAILSAKLPHLFSWIEARQQHAANYRKLLKGSSISLPEVPALATHVYHVYCIQLDNRDSMKEHLTQAGIGTAIHYPNPLPYLDAYAHLNAQPSDFPVAYNAKSRILSLPMYPEMTREMMEYVVEQLTYITV